MKLNGRQACVQDSHGPVQPLRIWGVRQRVINTWGPAASLEGVKDRDHIASFLGLQYASNNIPMKRQFPPFLVPGRRVCPSPWLGIKLRLTELPQ